MSKIAPAAFIIQSSGFHSDKDLHTTKQVVKSRKSLKSKQKGPYLMGETIGEGAFAKVKVATHIQTNEKVAIKILDKTKFFKDIEDISRVEKEIAILKKLKHKNIIQLYEIMESQKNLYIVMEYCEGKELFDFIVKKKKLSEFEACKFFQEIINALEYLHLNYVTHRDLKPENLLLDFSKSIKISDFGLSTLYKKGSLLSTPCGTPNYAPPEMLRGEEYNGMLSDVWSCGIILYAMLCGYLPFSESKEQIIYQKIIEHDYEYPSFLSDSAVDLMKRILNVDPRKRFDIDKIKRHPWFNSIKADLKPGISIGLMQIPIDNRILSKVESLGVDKNLCKNKILQNKFDSVTTVYYLCLRRFIKEGGKSNSDLNSYEFIEYIKAENRRLGIEDRLIDNANYLSNEEENYKETEINDNKLDTERVANNSTSQYGDQVEKVQNDLYSAINYNLNTNEDFDPANADVDVIDENIESNKNIKTENELFSKLQKICLSDRANKSKIKFMQENETIFGEKEKLKCEQEFSPRKSFDGQKATVIDNKNSSSKNISSKNKYEINLTENNSKTRNCLSRQFTNPQSSRTLESKENSLLTLNLTKEKHQTNKSFFKNNEGLESEIIKIKDFQNSNSNMNYRNTVKYCMNNDENIIENPKSNNEIYDNIIEIVANLNQKNALNNHIYEGDNITLTEKTEDYPKRKINQKSSKNESKIEKKQNNKIYKNEKDYLSNKLKNEENNNDYNEPNESYRNSNANLINEINNFDLNKVYSENNNYNDNNLKPTFNSHKDQKDNKANSKNSDKNYENTNNMNKISNKNINLKEKLTNTKNIKNSNNEILIIDIKDNSKIKSNQLNDNSNNNNIVNNSKDKKEYQNANKINIKTAHSNKNESSSQNKSSNKNIFNVNFNISNTKLNKNPNINLNNIFEKNLMFKNLRKISTSESQTATSNFSNNLNNLNNEEKLIHNVLNSEGNVSNNNRSGSNSNNIIAAKQPNESNSKSKKIKNLVSKIANNIGNDLKVIKQKNLILQNIHVKSFVSTNTNNTTINNATENNKEASKAIENNLKSNKINFNSNCNNLINNEKCSIIKRANAVIFNNNSKNPSFASNTEIDTESNLFVNKSNKNSFFESLKVNLTGNKNKLNSMYYRNSVCVPSEENSEIKNKILFNSNAKENEKLNIREKLKEYSASIASPYEMKGNPNVFRKDSFTKTSQEKDKISYNCFSKEKQFKGFNNKFIKNLNKDKVKEKEILLYDNKDENHMNKENQKIEGNQPVKKYKKVISLNTKLIDNASNINNNNNTNKNCKKTIFSPANKNKISNDLKNANDITHSLENYNSKVEQNKLSNNNNKSNLGDSYIESKKYKNKNDNLNTNYNNNNNIKTKNIHFSKEGKTNQINSNNDFTNKPQSTKNKLKISINKNYVKSPVNSQLRSQANVFSNANAQSKNDGKLNARKIVLEINNVNENKALDRKGENSLNYQEQFIIKRIKDLEDKKINSKTFKNINSNLNSNEEKDNEILTSLNKVKNSNLPSTNKNALVSSCNYEEIKRIKFNDLMNDNKINNKNTLTTENDFCQNQLAKFSSNHNSEPENDFEEELNKLELYPNINVLEYIANKLVKKSISNMETSMKTNGENSTAVYSNLYKSFFKSESAYNSKRHQISSDKNSSLNQNNSNTISIKDSKEDKKDLFSANSDNASFIEDEKETYNFDEMIGLFNKKYRNVVCNLKNENKENSFITIENNLNHLNNLNYDNEIQFDKADNFYVESIENNTSNNTHNLNCNKNPVSVKLSYQSEKNDISEDKKDLKNKRNEVNRNIAKSFVVSPNSKNVDAVNYNNNFYIKNIGNSKQFKNEAKYSKSFVDKANDLNQKSKINSSNNNNNNNNKNNYNIIYSLKKKDNDSNSKKKLLKKFPHKINLNVKKDKNNINSNDSNISAIKQSILKNEKKVVKIKEIKERANLNTNSNDCFNNLNNYPNKTLINKKPSFKNQQTQEVTINDNLNFLNSNHYKKILSSNSSVIHNSNNSNKIKEFINQIPINYKKEENSFFSDSYKNNNEILFNQKSIFNSNENLTTNDFIDSNKLKQNQINCNQESKLTNANGVKEKQDKQSLISKINLTNNSFNKNAILDISATYDPDLDSRNETSVERSQSINNRNRFYNMRHMSLSPKQNINFSSNIINHNSICNNNIRTLNMNIRDSSVSSSNSNFNENVNNNNLKHFGIDALDNVRMVDNANDIISNYDNYCLYHNERNRASCNNLRKYSNCQSSIKPKRFGTIGIISEDDEFNNQNMSIIKSKEPFNSFQNKNYNSSNDLIRSKVDEQKRNKFDDKIFNHTNKIDYNKEINNKNNKNSLIKVLSFNDQSDINDPGYCNVDSNTYIKNSIFNNTIKTKTADYSPIKIVNSEIKFDSFNKNKDDNNQIMTSDRSRVNLIQKNYMKNIYPNEKRVTIDLANSINK